MAQLSINMQVETALYLRSIHHAAPPCALVITANDSYGSSSKSNYRYAHLIDKALAPDLIIFQMQICCVSPTFIGLSMPPPSAKYALPPSALSIPYPPCSEYTLPCVCARSASEASKLLLVLELPCLSLQAIEFSTVSRFSTVSFSQRVFPLPPSAPSFPYRN